MATSPRLTYARQRIDCLWRAPGASEAFSAGVSLHSHTAHSREYLDLLARVLYRTPVAAPLLRALERRHLRSRANMSHWDRTFWRPPLDAAAAYALESAQLRALGLRDIVLLSDHDNLEACAELRASGVDSPLSLEWTVPYQPTVFHLGVYNLPAGCARLVAAEMARYTAQPRSAILRDLLGDLNRMPDVLVILNHPLNNEERTGRQIHARLLDEFLALYAGSLHALELNGLQPAADNRAVLDLCAATGLPPVSGGDRHGREPNANINLTRATTFAEFVHEIRRERRSHVLFLPQYREPIAARYAQFIWHAVQHCPEQPGRERWLDRFFHEDEIHGVRSLAALLPDGGPHFLNHLVRGIGLAASPWSRATLQLALGANDAVS